MDSLQRRPGTSSGPESFDDFYNEVSKFNANLVDSEIWRVATIFLNF